ncbi:uncharacterized protein LOC132649326 [Meriones unguiculatus]|uniref:uncharacterized protein LOC132649326 n=1 Tax=Meriones unguiculatus TaxID=10047 RepID=UPI00293ECA0D|nr:uncharacterized protein LOC132649326 [Meriones unguiculatus]
MAGENRLLHVLWPLLPRCGTGLLLYISEFSGFNWTFKVVYNVKAYERKCSDGSVGCPVTIAEWECQQVSLKKESRDLNAERRAEEASGRAAGRADAEGASAPSRAASAVPGAAGRTAKPSPTPRPRVRSIRAPATVENNQFLLNNFAIWCRSWTFEASLKKKVKTDLSAIRRHLSPAPASRKAEARGRRVYLSGNRSKEEINEITDFRRHWQCFSIRLCRIPGPQTVKSWRDAGAGGEPRPPSSELTEPLSISPACTRVLLLLGCSDRVPTREEEQARAPAQPALFRGSAGRGGAPAACRDGAGWRAPGSPPAKPPPPHGTGLPGSLSKQSQNTSGLKFPRRSAREHPNNSAPATAALRGGLPARGQTAPGATGLTSQPALTSGQQPRPQGRTARLQSDDGEDDDYNSDNDDDEDDDDDVDDKDDEDDDEDDDGLWCN